MNISEINTAIIHGSFSNDDLTSIIDAVKFARSKLGRQNIYSFRPGAKVQFTNKQGRIVVGEVVDVKVKNVIVQVAMTRWKVPASMLTAVETA